MLLTSSPDAGYINATSKIGNANPKQKKRGLTYAHSFKRLINVDFSQASAFANANGDDVSDDDSAETIATTINTHMANLTAQTAASLDANTTNMNATIQKLETTNAQLQQQQQLMMQQMAMLTMNSNQ